MPFHIVAFFCRPVSPDKPIVWGITEVWVHSTECSANGLYIYYLELTLPFCPKIFPIALMTE